MTLTKGHNGFLHGLPGSPGSGAFRGSSVPAHMIPAAPWVIARGALRVVLRVVDVGHHAMALRRAPGSRNVIANYAPRSAPSSRRAWSAPAQLVLVVVVRAGPWPRPSCGVLVLGRASVCWVPGRGGGGRGGPGWGVLAVVVVRAGLGSMGHGRARPGRGSGPSGGGRACWPWSWWPPACWAWPWSRSAWPWFWWSPARSGPGSSLAWSGPGGGSFVLVPAGAGVGPLSGPGKPRSSGQVEAAQRPRAVAAQKELELILR
jgi:hypothetical protein